MRERFVGCAVLRRLRRRASWRELSRRRSRVVGPRLAEGAARRSRQYRRRV